MKFVLEKFVILERMGILFIIHSFKSLESSIYFNLITSFYHRWTASLVEQRDYDEYSMSMAPDPGQQRRLLPRALMKRYYILRYIYFYILYFNLFFISKLRYLYYEALGDLFPTQWGTLESNLATIIFIIAFWLRMYMHYIIQYLFLQVS